MDTDSLWETLPHLLSTSTSSDELFDEWLRLADQEFSTRNETLETFLPIELQQKLQTELKRRKKQFSVTASNIIKRNSRAIWVGLFEEATASAYRLTTYLSVSKTTSNEDKEWECSGAIFKPSYTALPSLTKAHKKPPDCSADTASAIYIFLPVAFLAALTLEMSQQSKLKKIEEYGFGWDSGDYLKWRP